MSPWWLPFIAGIVGVAIGAAVVSEQPQRPTATTQNQDLTARINVLESTTQRLTSELEGVRNRQQPYLASLATTPNTIYLNISSQSYSLLDTNLGVVMVMVDDVQPYGDGQRLTLRVGNPHSADFVGFKASFSYGGGQSKEEKLTTRLRAGAWTTFQVILPGLSRDNLNSIVFSLELSVVGLQNW